MFSLQRINFAKFFGEKNTPRTLNSMMKKFSLDLKPQPKIRPHEPLPVYAAHTPVPLPVRKNQVHDVRHVTCSNEK